MELPSTDRPLGWGLTVVRPDRSVGGAVVAHVAVVQLDDAVPLAAVNVDVRVQTVPLARQRSLNLLLRRVRVDAAEGVDHLRVVEDRGHGRDARRIGVHAAAVSPLHEPEADEHDGREAQETLQDPSDDRVDLHLGPAFAVAVAELLEVQQFRRERRQEADAGVEDRHGQHQPVALEHGDERVERVVGREVVDVQKVLGQSARRLGEAVERLHHLRRRVHHADQDPVHDGEESRQVRADKVFLVREIDDRTIHAVGTFGGEDPPFGGRWVERPRPGRNRGSAFRLSCHVVRLRPGQHCDIWWMERFSGRPGLPSSPAGFIIPSCPAVLVPRRSDDAVSNVVNVDPEASVVSTSNPVTFAPEASVVTTASAFLVAPEASVVTTSNPVTVAPEASVVTICSIFSDAGWPISIDSGTGSVKVARLVISAYLPRLPLRRSVLLR